MRQATASGVYPPLGGVPDPCRLSRVQRCHAFGAHEGVQRTNFPARVPTAPMSARSRWTVRSATPSFAAISFAVIGAAPIMAAMASRLPPVASAGAGAGVAFVAARRGFGDGRGRADDAFRPPR